MDHAVAIIKNKIDTVDPFYIYKINDRKWNGSGTYIFKSSQTTTKIGLAMYRTARQTPFRDLVAHMDGLHSHVKGFVTLTLWVKNPVSLITHRLACMKCESEDTTNVIHFLTLYILYGIYCHNAITALNTTVHSACHFEQIYFWDFFLFLAAGSGF